MTDETVSSAGIEAAASTSEAKTVSQVLAECAIDRMLLQSKLDVGIKDLWTEALVCLEQALPHTKGDGSHNEQLFRAYRHRVLGKGNNLSREITEELKCWATTQMVERTQVQKIVVAGSGPHNLPTGVRMRNPVAAKTA